jgi:hypothetical protein
MSKDDPVPTPEQIQAWLRAHGWTPEDPPPANPEDGIDFTYKERSDDGQEIWVRAPQTAVEPPWYPLLVRAVIVTAAGMEDRPEAEVLAEMLAVNPQPLPPARTPPVPTT